MAEPRRKRTRQQKRVTATRQKLLDAAREVFARKGLDLTRIDEITERADVGKGTFYYHFQSKERLIRELIRTMLGDLSGRLEEECTEVSDLSELLDRLILVHTDFFRERWEDFVLYYQGRSDLTLQEGYEGIETPFLDYLKTIERLIAGPLKQPLPPGALRRVACAVAGFVSGYYSFAVIATDEESIAEAVSPMRSAMVASLTRFIATAAQPAAGD